MADGISNGESLESRDPKNDRTLLAESSSNPLQNFGESDPKTSESMSTDLPEKTTESEFQPDGNLPEEQKQHSETISNSNNRMQDEDVVDVSRPQVSTNPINSDNDHKETPQTTPTNELPSFEELKGELDGYKALKAKSYRIETNTPVYLLSKAWHHKWKKYVKGQCHNYSYMNYGAEYDPTAPRAYPGPITNKDILFDGDFYKSEESDDICNSPLKSSARERYEYKVITKEQWDFLFAKYGGVPLKRNCYKGDYYSYYTPEIRSEQMNLIILPPKDEFSIDKISEEKPIFISRRSTLNEMRERIIKVLNQSNYGYNLTSGNFRLWRLNRYLDMGSVMSNLEKEVERIKTTVINNVNPDIEENTSLEFPGVPLDLLKNCSNVEKLYFFADEKLIIEQANAKGEFIFKFMKNVKIGRCEFCCQDRPLTVLCRCKEVFYCSASCLKRDEQFHQNKCIADELEEDLSSYKQTPNSSMGLTGLQNLGNTCFMNSGLQCLSNTILLSRYFLENHYLPEINGVNPLGTKGRLAKAFAKFIKSLWFESDRTFSPSGLKRVIGKFHKNFMGTDQQDGQELITTVLDGLHEDLNRVINKPYVELKTIDDPNDNSMVSCAWYNYLARNQSIVVDLMHGQYKSVVKCPKCNKYSITFDPFSIIPLPVPATKERTIKLHYVPYNTSKGIINFTLVVKKVATIEDIREKVAEVLNVPKDGSIFVMLSAKTFDRFLCKEQRSKLITKTHNSELYIQEINPRYFNGPENEGMEKRKMAELKSIDGVKLPENKAELLNTKDSEMSGSGFTEDTKKEVEEKKGLIEETKDLTPSITVNSIGPAAPPTNVIKDHDDYNNGLCDDMLKVCLNIYTRVTYTYYSNYVKERKTFNRLIYVKRSHTMKELHMEIFRYFRPLFELSLSSVNSKKRNDKGEGKMVQDGENGNGAAGGREGMLEERKDGGNEFRDGIGSIPEEGKNENKKDGEENFDGMPELEQSNTNKELLEVKKLSDEELFNLLFKDFNEENWKEKMQGPNDYPYEVRFVNPENKYGYNREKCPYCDSAACENCLIPFTNTSKVQDLVGKLSKDYKGDYFYYEHTYYGAGRKEFEFEVIFHTNRENWKLDLDRLDHIEESKDSGLTENNSGTKVSIYSCFEQFSNWETLDENNVWFCPTCQDSVQALKRMEILRCPPILILNLKRFKVKDDKMTCRAGGRLSALVEFPLQGLDLTKYAHQDKITPLYDLYAVSNHYGSTEFGHYTAFALNQGDWYKFDDSSVYKVDASQICSTAAYVLFYKRRDITDTLDYSILKQTIPEWYKVPVIETSSSKAKVKDECKSNEDTLKIVDGEQKELENRITGNSDIEKNGNSE